MPRRGSKARFEEKNGKESQGEFQFSQQRSNVLAELGTETTRDKGNNITGAPHRDHDHQVCREKATPFTGSHESPKSGCSKAPRFFFMVSIFTGFSIL